jgi:uncharacterized damage-inducible protein DinB
MFRFAVMLLFAFAVAAPAQDNALAGIKDEWSNVKKDVLTAANKAPEDIYGFKPTEEVFAFRKMLLHIAGASYNICAGFQDKRGSQPKVDVDKQASKAEVIDTLNAAFGYCDAAMAAASDATLAETIKAPSGRTRPKSWYASHLLAHTAMHYGNIVTYMRLKGMSPGE